MVALTLAESDFYPAEGPYPGEVVASYKYDDWGNLVEKTGTVETPFGYRGQFGYVYDKETKLYFLKTRYYDPETGRFTTKDRFKGFENRPASQNQYTYCEGDPVNAVDPDGSKRKLIYKLWLGFGSYLDIFFDSKVETKKQTIYNYYLFLYMTAGGFAVNGVGLIMFGSGQVVATSLRALGASLATRLGWMAANLARSYTWRYSTSYALRVAKSKGAYKRLFSGGVYASIVIG